MALFDKKSCDICGDSIGMLGNLELGDGNCCKGCANRLSPWMTNRSCSTVTDIREHLAYREENKRKLAQFRLASIVGEDRWNVYVDPNMGAFTVSDSNNWRADNPDIILFSQVISCEVDCIEQRKEVYQQVQDGSKRSYSPPHYSYFYDFEVIIQINSPWFQEMKFKLNTKPLTDRSDPRFRQYEALGDQIRSTLQQTALPRGSG